MENPERGNRKHSKKENFKIILQWIGMNFLGWSLAVLLGFQLGDGYLIDGIVYMLGGNLLSLETIIDSMGIFVWFPFGFWIGLLQALYLRKWHVSFLRWILATSTGVGLSIALWTCIYDQLIIKLNSRIMILFFALVSIYVLSTFLGWLQYLVLKHNFDKSANWVTYSQIGYTVWLLVLSVVFYLLLLIPETPGLGGGMYDMTIMILLLLLLPIILIVPSFITGLFLARNRKAEVESVVGETVLSPSGVN